MNEIKWIKTSERVPENDDQVICYDAEEEKYFITRYWNHHWQGEWGKTPNVTAWAQLTPYKEAGGVNTIDEAIEYHNRKAEELTLRAISYKADKKYSKSVYKEAECHIQEKEWLEKLKTIENIMLQYNADLYADEDNGIPDCEVLEAIWNVIQDNGIDIDIEQDYRKGRNDGYNKAIEDFIAKARNTWGDFTFEELKEIAEELKEEHK